MPELHNEATRASYFLSILNYNLFTTNFNVFLFFPLYYRKAMNYHSQFLPQQMVHNSKYALV
ncbi:hypothetical protein BCN_2944 [Bacillus cereus NC7401]|nr:hypothetical protein BCN_2944 [Bacillus cereus NC7401]